MTKLLPRPTKGSAGAALIGASAPFLLAAGGPESLPPEVASNLPWWAVLLISSVSPAIAWGVSFTLATAFHTIAGVLQSRGRPMLEDSNPNNDAAAKALLAAALEIEKSANRLDRTGGQ